MNIKTKANIGEIVYYMKSNKIYENKVSNITVNVYADGMFQVANTVVLYQMDVGDKIEEEDVFTSKDDLVDSLLEIK